MKPDQTVFIIGAGQAGAQVAASLRQFGFEGHIIMAGDEAALPYQRPPLSKAYLKGEMEQERLYLKPSAWYETQNVTLHLESTVTNIYKDSQTARLDDGTEIKFDHLVFATGSRNRQLPMDGADLPNVFGLRTLSDVDALRPHIGPGKNLVIIGAGYIGLETAAAAKTLGANVTVLELAERVLERVTSPTISAFYEGLHQSHGVSIETNAQTASLNEKDGRIESVTLASGEVLPCDALLIGIGIIPNIKLAKDIGVICEDGIIVDANARTNISNIYAAGDCAKRQILPYGHMGRLESVHNAIEQGKQIAAAIMDKDAPRLDCPWFWSDQYDIKLQIAGLSTGYDDFVIRGSVEDQAFSVFYFKDDILIAADAINNAPEFMTAKRLIPMQVKVPPALLANAEQSLKDIVAQFK